MVGDWELRLSGNDLIKYSMICLYHLDSLIALCRIG